MEKDVIFIILCIFDIFSYLHLAIRASMASQIHAHPCLQQCSSQPFLTQFLFNTLPVFAEYGQDEANDCSKVNCMHTVAWKHLLDTKMLDSPEGVEQ